MADESNTQQSFFTSLPIDTSGATLVPGRYITDVGVQWGIIDLTLLFFEAKQPLSPFTDPEQTRIFLESLSYTPADCAGRMILTIERAEVLYNLLGHALRSAHDARAQRLFADHEQMEALKAETAQRASQNETPKGE